MATQYSPTTTTTTLLPSFPTPSRSPASSSSVPLSGIHLQPSLPAPGIATSAPGSDRAPSNVSPSKNSDRDAPGVEEDFEEEDEEGDVVMRVNGVERTPREEVGAEERREDAERRERDDEEERQTIIDKVLKRAEIAKVSLWSSAGGETLDEVGSGTDQGRVGEGARRLGDVSRFWGWDRLPVPAL